MDMLSNWNLSLYGFYFERLQEWWKIPLEVPALRSADDYVELHEQFLDKMVGDYAEQAENLLEIVRSEFQLSRDTEGSDYETRLLKAQQDAARIIDQAKAQAEHIIAEAEARAGQTVVEPETHAATPRKRRKSA
jgi:regulator of protease activity HflC (stomatin/prohibitin superfamily)